MRAHSRDRNANICVEFRFILRNKGREETERATRDISKTLNPRQKKSAKKKERIFFLSFTRYKPPQITLRFIRKRETYSCSLSCSLSLSLCTYIVRFETLSVYIFAFRSRECALISGAEEERLTLSYIYHIHQSGRRDLDWIDPVKKRVSECLEGRKLKREEV